MKIGDKFKDRLGREWTVLAKTVGGKKMWIGHLAQVLDFGCGDMIGLAQWKYTNIMLIDADYDGNPDKDVTGIGHASKEDSRLYQIGEGSGALRVDSL